MELWPHQERGIGAVLDALDAGHKRILLVAATGSGKTVMMAEVAQKCLDLDWPVSVYTNRKMLVQQLSKSLGMAGIPHGIRAAGHSFEPDSPMQISSISTEGSRVLTRKTWPIHPARVAFVDECHINQGGVMGSLRTLHLDSGAQIIDVTATPLNLTEQYDVMIEAGKVSECFKCGALVPVIHFGPDEPDMVSWKRANKQMARQTQEGAMTEQQVKSIMGNRSRLFGRVWPHFERLNPDRRPTILFAPGVDESIWFAEQFCSKGVRFAHIDGSNVWVDGELHRTNDEVRQQVLDDSKSGRIVGISNRFVMREGVDAPWLQHGILATVFGSLQTYLQSVGRLLRAFPGVEHVTLQDHGGNWWRYGSANEDRDWVLGQTSEQAFDKRAERIRQGKEKQPFTCPSCGRVWVAGKVCNVHLGGCGYALPESQRSRSVVTTDGELKLIESALFPARKIMDRPDGPKLWEQIYYRARSRKWDATFRQAEAFFFSEYFAWPDRSWPLMPTNPDDIYRKVSEVSYERLTPKGSAAA